MSTHTTQPLDDRVKHQPRRQMDLIGEFEQEMSLFPLPSQVRQLEKLYAVPETTRLVAL